MPSFNPRNHYLRLLLGGAFVLIAGGFLFLLQPGGPGYAASPSVPDARHRTPTVTPTLTPTGDSVSTQNAEDEIAFDPFIGFESVPAFLSAAPDLCRDAVVAPGGETWVLSDSFFRIGDPGSFSQTTLYVQRCVGDFQPWTPTGSSNDSGVLHLLPPVAVFLPTATPSAPSARALVLPGAAFRVLPTPVPLDRAPVLAPIFSTPLVPVLPTIAAPGRFRVLPVTRVTLRTPDGQKIILPNAQFNRPDLWSYTFPIDSPSGDYELTLTSGGNTQTRQIRVSGAARIYATDRRGQLQSKFGSPNDAVITFADFQSGRKVEVLLYRVVETLAVDVFTSDPLAEVGRWTFTPGNQSRRERLSQRLRPSHGPAYGTFVLLACYVDECNKLPRISVGSRRVIWPQMALGSVYIEPDASVLALPNSFETIRFAPGSIDAHVDLTLSDTTIAGYLLTAQAGQRMRIELDTPNVQVYVLDPSGELLLPTGQGLGVWEFTLAQSGQQRLILYGVEDGHMTITIPPGTAGPAQPPTATPTATPQSASPGTFLRDMLLAKMAAADTPNGFPHRANALVENLLVHLSDFDQTGIGALALEEFLSQDDVGDRINGIVHAVWGDWSRNSGNPLNDNPAGLSPFRQLVVRLIQGRTGTLSAQEQRAIVSWLTRRENLSVWRDNPNGVIGAINREIFP